MKNKILSLIACLLVASVETVYSQDEWSPSDSVMARYLRSEGLAVTNNNEMKLLKSGTAKFEALFEEVRKAKKYIHLEYFNFRNDSIANALFDLLEEKAKEGVKVRAMYDDFGNMSNNQPISSEMHNQIRERGIDLVIYDPIRFPWLNHIFCRDHQKIVIIDGRIGFTGGMNIADYYIQGLPEIGEWRDMHIRIEGPAVEDLQSIFVTMWEEETGEKLEGEEYFPYTSEGSYDSEAEHLGRQVAIVQRAPHKTPKAARKAYIAAIDAAERNIEIINPYFVPTASIKRALKRAVKKGVKVDIMIPAKSDIPFTPDAAFYTANKLRKKGAHIYVYNGGFHHSKIMMVDNRFCTVGSINLNSRSLRYDYEVNAFIMDLPITDELNRMFHDDKQNSTVLTRDEYMKRTTWKRFLGWFAHLFTPFL